MHNVSKSQIEMRVKQKAFFLKKKGAFPLIMKAEDRRTLEEIMELIKKLKGFTFDKEVADALGMDDGTLATAKGRNSLPLKFLIPFCIKEKLSFDWLVLGKELREPLSISSQIIQKIIQHLDSMTVEEQREALKHFQKEKLLKKLVAKYYKE